MNKQTTFAAVLAVIFSLNAQAMECPVKELGTQPDGSDYVDAVVKLIVKAESCYDAKELGEACGFGAAVNGVIIGEAVAVCDQYINKNLKFKLSKAKTPKSKLAVQTHVSNVRKNYGFARGLCEKKFEKDAGTLAVSATAFCLLNVAYTYSDLTEESSFGPQE